jgi:hypothetical protein
VPWEEEKVTRLVKSEAGLFSYRGGAGIYRLEVGEWGLSWGRPIRALLR